MKYTIRIALMAAAISFIGFGLGGCGSPPQSVISNISDSSITVQSQFRNATDPEIQQKAEAGCAIYNKHAVPISFRNVDEYGFTKQVLFACQ